MRVVLITSVVAVCSTLAGGWSDAGAQPAAPRAAQRATSTTYPPYAGDSAGVTQRVDVRVDGAAPGSRRFDLLTTAPQRNNDPTSRAVTEVRGSPFVVSGSVLFDALFALALDDARQASVAAIRDGSYNDDAPIPCPCFETGEKWHYVWTRDLSYALDLGLAEVDPDRAVSSLLFKTSPFRPGVPVPREVPDSTTQLIQDTGSGGSWPISTDRVVWALGAERTLAYLDGLARASFARQAYAALRGTIEADRVATFDARDGLYGGEHSFLDWREQTYAPWIVDDLSAMAQSKALSTNVAQLRALRLASQLAGELGRRAEAARYSRWAGALRRAIDAMFWDAKAGLYATFTTSDRDAARIEKYDLLGNMLAIHAGVADAAKAKRILSRYPFGPFGPPVVWPQAPDEYVYHNRAMWPFVTAYALRAAAAFGHVEAADRTLSSLMRGAALHLSNMENLEWLTGASRFDDGPAINSRRQLWSIGAYVGAITSTVFGWQVDAAGAHVAPFLTQRTRALFDTATTVRLAGLRYRGKPVEIVLALPAAVSSASPAASRGVYPVRSVRLNGALITGAITVAQLRDTGNRIEVTFSAARPSHDSVTTVALVPPRSHDDPRVFMPRTPVVSATLSATSASTANVALRLSSPPQPGPVTYRVWRDGHQLATGLSATTWTDLAPPRDATLCYRAVAVHVSSGLASQASEQSCVRGALAQTIAVTDARVSGVDLMPAGDSVAVPTRRLKLGGTLVVQDIVIRATGDYAIGTLYDNHVFALNTGVTNAVKRLAVIDAGGARQSAVLQMPHIRAVDAAHPIRSSTRAYVHLAAGRYRIELTDFLNMSALASNATYTGAGGKGGPVNEARIAAITIDKVASIPER